MRVGLCEDIVATAPNLFLTSVHRRLTLPVAIIASAFLCLVSASTFAQTAIAEPEPSSREWERILPVATNLKADGEKANAAKKPILLFFNLGGCHYCRYSLRTTIIPMFRDAGWRDAMEFRQITVDDDTSLIDFDGKKVTTIAFAKARKGEFTPTIMVVDGDGKSLGDPVIGIANQDFYSVYVEALAKKGVETMKARK
jgi:thioredoxin-related protein